MDIKQFVFNGMLNLSILLDEDDGSLISPLNDSLAKHAEERGYKVGRCVKSDVVQNKDSEEEILCKGHWIFDLLEEPVKKEAVKPEVKEASAAPTPNGVQTLTAKKKTTAKSKRRKKTEE